HTSFGHSKRVTFNTKLLLNEFPLLSLLQTFRRLDLYHASWKCACCNSAPETWLHLWHCPRWLPLFQQILNETKHTLLLLVSAYMWPQINHRRLSSDPTWNLLSCWTYPSSFFQSYQFSFESLIKGFIPQDLLFLLQQYVPKSTALSLIGQVTTIAKDSV